MKPQNEAVLAGEGLAKADDERLPIALLFFVLIVVACLMPAQNDTWWLLRTGEEMWQSGRVMLRDEFTHTVTGQFWLNHEWGAQLLFYGLYRIGGLPLLTAFCAAAVISAWWIVSRLTPGSVGLRLILIGTGAALTTAGWSLRAQTITLGLFATTLWIVVRARFLWVLPLIFLVWANLHGAVATGGMLIASGFIAALLVRRELLFPLSIVGTFCGVAMTLTPLGLSFWLEIPRSIARAKAIGIDEWRVPALTNPADLPLWAAVIGLAVVIIRAKDKLRSYESLTLAIASAVTLLLALRGARNIALFFVCAVPTAAMFLTSHATPEGTSATGARFKSILVACAVLCAAFVGYAWSKPLDRLAWHPVPDQMRTAIEQCDGALYNRYDEGGYLLWFVKGRKVFMDSRQDPFPEQMVIDQRRLEATGDYEETFDRYAIRCALVLEGSPLSRRLANDGWHSHPAGPGWIVYSTSKRSDEHSKNVLGHSAGKQPNRWGGGV